MIIHPTRLILIFVYVDADHVVHHTSNPDHLQQEERYKLMIISQEPFD